MEHFFLWLEKLNSSFYTLPHKKIESAMYSFHGLNFMQMISCDLSAATRWYDNTSWKKQDSFKLCCYCCCQSFCFVCAVLFFHPSQLLYILSLQADKLINEISKVEYLDPKETARKEWLIMPIFLFQGKGVWDLVYIISLICDSFYCSLFNGLCL